jgi:hypothetical protein
METVNKPLLSIDEMFAKDDTQYEVVDVPEWGGSIRIGSLRAGDMLDWVDATEGKAKRTAGLRLIIKSLVDTSGKRIGAPDMLERLKQRDHAVVSRIVEQILKLNKMNVVKKAQEDAKNDSGEADTDASPID